MLDLPILLHYFFVIFYSYTAAAVRVISSLSRVIETDFSGTNKLLVVVSFRMNCLPQCVDTGCEHTLHVLKSSYHMVTLLFILFGDVTDYDSVLYTVMML